MKAWSDTPVTVAIAGVIAFVSALLLWTGFLQLGIYAGGVIPARLSGIADLPPDVAVVPPLLTPLTAALVHGGWAHLGFNLLTFVYTGQASERALGRWGLLLLFVVGAYAAAAAQWAVDPIAATPMVGASGAISAVMASYALLYGEQRRQKAWGPFSARALHILWLAAAWIGINLLFGFVGWQAGQPIAIAAHIGGFIAGLALARPLLLWRWRRA